MLDELGSSFRLVDPEITLEANPDDVTAEKAADWKQAGVNRISLGVQSFEPRVLRYLGRRHDADGARRACEIIGDTLENWNIDLIFGARPVAAWEATLKETAAISPPHVAAYGLTYEAGTPFERRQHEAIDDDAALELYRTASTTLQGYHHYEISNFAKPGYESRHNLIYWRNGEYAGFGTGAYSFLDGLRARNAVSNDAYLQAPGEKSEVIALSDAEQRVETVIQYLRLRSGLPKAAYRERFGAGVDEDFGGALQTLKKRGLIDEDETIIRPTEQGFYLNNEIGLALV